MRTARRIQSGTPADKSKTPRTLAGHTLGPAEKECSKAPDLNIEDGSLRRALAWAQLEMVLALEEAPRYLVEPHYSRVNRAGQLFKELYSALGERALASGRNRWRLQRKFHPFMHVLDDMKRDRVKCRFFSGWTDETLMCQARACRFC